MNIKKGTFFLNIFFLVSLAAVILADRITKSAGINFCNAFFCVKRAANTGAAFSLLQGFNWLLIITALAVIFLCFLFYPKSSNKTKLAIILILAGTSSNLLDRIVYGYVRDWLSFGFINFPSFNIADAANCIGVLILILGLIKKK